MIRTSSFIGEIPRLIPRLLPQAAAQGAWNTKLEDGAIVPIRRGRFVHHFNEVMRTIYRHDEEWLGWPGFVNVAPGPIAEDRLYVTGDGAPKLIVNDETLPLAIPSPTTAPSATPFGPPDPDLQTEIRYVYTWVTTFGEETAPSPLTDPILWSPGVSVTLAGIEAPPQGRYVTSMRFYRSQTNALDETVLHFVHERPASQSSWTDVVENNPIQEPITTLDFQSPPDGLRGIVTMPNGMMAAFVGKDVYFCEPYQPHAWPEKYILRVDSPIVGLGVFGSALAILTTGRPAVATGTHPENMTMEYDRTILPCVSARGIVDLGYTVAYPSTDGLVTISMEGASLVRGLFKVDQWRTMNPYSFVAGQFGGRYMASYAYGDGLGIEHRGILIIDLTGEQPFLVRASDDADAMYHDIRTGELFLLRNGQDVYEWDAISEPYGEQLWKSKRFVLPGHTNFGCILVEGDDTMTAEDRAEVEAANEAIREANRELIDTEETGGPIADRAIGLVTFGGSLLTPIEEADIPTFSATVYADGKPVHTIYEMNRALRLPAGFRALTWEVEIRGNQRVTSISLAATPNQLAVA